MRLSKAGPSEVFAFLESVAALGAPCTIEQVRAHLKAQWPPVRGAKTFAEQYELIENRSGLLTLSPLGRRLLRYTGRKRVEFVVRHWRLQDHEPFQDLRIQVASRSSPISTGDLADLVRVKFLPSEKWSADDRKGYGRTLSVWLAFMGFVELKGDHLSYIGGEIVTPSPLALIEMEFLKERELRDFFVESLESPQSIVGTSRQLLDRVALESVDDIRGKLFHQFIATSARHLGFSPRVKNSPFEVGTPVSFASTSGGGDLVLLFHHPVEAREHTFQGGALACEAKSTESNVGSKAIGQARNLAARVEDSFPEYLVMPVVVSRSRIGYDHSALDQATPEVIHLTGESLLTLLDYQRNQFAAKGRLVLPPLIFQLLDGLVRDEMLEPNPKDLADRLTALIGTS